MNDIEITNVSANGTPDHGRSRPTRTLRRDPLGKFAKVVHRRQTEIGGTEEAHTVSPGDDYFAPDWSANVDPERKSNSHGPARDALISHIMSCPACATGGACG